MVETVPSKDLLSLMGTWQLLKVVDSNDFDFGAGDFTMEYWYHEGNDARTERRVIYCYNTNQAFLLGHTNDNGGQLFSKHMTLVAI